jgi:hypothetical protein
MQQPSLQGIAITISNVAAFAQHHGVLMFLLGTLVMVRLRNRMLRLAQSA